MTTTDPARLESEVVHTLKIMLEKYQRIDELTNLMLEKQSQGISIEPEIESLRAEREALQTIEQHAQPANEAYRKAHANASEQVHRLTEQTGKLIQQVVQKIAKLEVSAREAYKQLIPEIGQNVRGNQMKQAYGNAGH